MGSGMGSGGGGSARAAEFSLLGPGPQRRAKIVTFAIPSRVDLFILLEAWSHSIAWRAALQPMLQRRRYCLAQVATQSTEPSTQAPALYYPVVGEHNCTGRRPAYCGTLPASVKVKVRHTAGPFPRPGAHYRTHIS